MTMCLKKIYLLSFLFLLGCMKTASVVSGEQPDWVNGESSKYPNSAFVAASGSASNPELAQNRALANLTKVFELRIRESSTTREDIHVKNQNGAESLDKSQRLVQKVDIETDKIIDGAQVVEQWSSPDLTYYALAVLDRRQAGNNIREEMAKLDKQITFELDSVKSKSGALQKVAVYQRVLATHDQRDALQKTLKIIDLSGRGAASSWNRADLRAQLEASLADLKMKPEVLQDATGKLDKLLKGAMAKSGFPESASPNGYILATGLELQSPTENQGWYWMRGKLTLRLTSPDGKVQGNKTWPLKVSATDRQQLNHRILAKVEDLLNQELKATIMGFSAVE